MKKITYLFLIQFLLLSVSAQDCVNPQQIPLEPIQYIVNELASERFGGRYPGTEGDSLATWFIVENLREMGLIPMGDSGTYIQKFDIKLQAHISENTQIRVRRRKYFPDEHVYPTRYSSNGKIRGKVVIPLFILQDKEPILSNPTSVRRKIALVNLSDIKNLYDSQGIDFKYFKLSSFIEYLREKNARALIFTSSQTRGLPIPDRYFEVLEPAGIPVWYADSDVSENIRRAKRIRTETQLYENQVTTNNIIAFWDVGSPYTIAIGAHYDHLGMGDKNSTYKGKPQLHPGADDNASGVAGVLTLARHLLDQGNNTFNYLFLFFGAEEQGLLGSKHWITHPTYPIENIVTMFNHDMIGRLADDRKLRINGTGTSPEWEKMLRKYQCFDLKYQLSRGGRGPSDHTSFYNQNIPVLHFFTGLHTEYHKPTDLPGYINFEGIRDVISLNATLIREMENLSIPPLFTPTDDEQEGRPVRLSVTLGIIPGYNTDNKGLEVEGVTKGKPAEKAGIIKGDYIIRIDDQPIKNIRDYMEALSRYDVGDTAPVQILRAEKILEVLVHFE
ncbi:MAG: M20/M25/M40 family metallo-hydrolase [Thermaurantimonas sp.]